MQETLRMYPPFIRSVLCGAKIDRCWIEKRSDSIVLRRQTISWANIRSPKERSSTCQCIRSITIRKSGRNPRNSSRRGSSSSGLGFHHRSLLPSIRFSASERAQRHPMAFLPFGDGPRWERLSLFTCIGTSLRSNCIGMRFALLEAKLAIAKALRVVEIQKSEETKVNPRISSPSGVILRRNVLFRFPSNLANWPFSRAKIRSVCVLFVDPNKKQPNAFSLILFK